MPTDDEARVIMDRHTKLQGQDVLNKQHGKQPNWVHMMRVGSNGYFDKRGMENLGYRLSRVSAGAGVPDMDGRYQLLDLVVNTTSQSMSAASTAIARLMTEQGRNAPNNASLIGALEKYGTFHDDSCKKSTDFAHARTSQSRVSPNP